jgi:polysaccharide biosynthesis/export protein
MNRRLSYIIGFIAAPLLLSNTLWGQSTAASTSAASSTPIPSTSASTAGQSAPDLHFRAPTYPLVPGDVVAITFPFTPELNQTVTVQPDGFINLLEAGNVLVKGLTTPELEAAVKKAYAPVVKDAVFTISLTQFDKPYIIVGGEVRSPGRYDLRSELTLMQAIQFAGGFTEASKHSQVWLYRQGPQGTLTPAKHIDVKQMLAKGSTAEDIVLQPGDMIYVPQNSFSKFKSLIIPRPNVATTFRPN